MQKLFLLFITITAFVGAYFGYSASFNRGLANTSPYTVRERISNQTTSPPLESLHSFADTPAFYIIKERNGKLAIFSCNSEGRFKLYEEYNISVNLLPEKDREALISGIKINTLDEVLMAIEDYIA